MTQLSNGELALTSTSRAYIMSAHQAILDSFQEDIEDLLDTPDEPYED